MQKNTLLQIMSIKIFILIILLLFFIKYIFNVMYGNHFMIQKMLFSKIKYYVKHFFLSRNRVDFSDVARFGHLTIVTCN